MPLLQYAVVAYVRNALGRWIEEVRREIHPDHAHLPAHVTILPPRPLHVPENEGVALLARLCLDVHPFEVTLGDVETFIPTTPTIFLRVAHAAYKMRELHDRLNTGALYADEPWPYMPHLTIVKMDNVEQARSAVTTVLDHWSRYAGTRRALVDQLTFVREGSNLRWDDVAPIPLGTQLASQRR